jgi:hypothetical protein
MNFRILIVFICLFFFRCSNTKNESDRATENFVVPHYGFETEIDKQYIRSENDSIIYTSTGTIMNHSKKVVKNYEVYVTFSILDDKGKTLLLLDDFSRVNTTVNDHLSPWKNELEKHFTLKYPFTEKEMEIPAQTVYISYKVKGVDFDTGKEINEIVGEGEITDMWREAALKKTFSK